jgi:hypothetical protein
MTDEEKKQLLQLIFTEIPTDHTGAGRDVRFEVRRHGEPTSSSFRRGAGRKSPLFQHLSERRDSMSLMLKTNRLVRDERGWLRLAG